MKLVPEQPPPGPARPEFWRSPLRSTLLTTVIGLMLLVAMTIVIVTGFLSHAAYQPDLGNNALVPRGDDLQLFVIGWPTSPSWLYALTQGLHVTVGIIATPLLLAKLWSVIPRLFAWPPPTRPGAVLERVSLLALVGSVFFLFATGITNAQLYYPWHFNFVVAHYYAAWVFTASLIVHVSVRVPTMRKALRARRELRPMVDDVLRAPDPDPATISRRGLLAMVGAASGALLVTTAGQSLGGPFRSVALFAPRGRGAHFPINKTARIARITPKLVGASYRLKLDGPTTVELSRPQLLALPQHTHDLQIACVEGWSTTQRWTGVRLADLARMAGAPAASQMLVGSLQPKGAFRQTTIGHDQLHHPHAMLALKVNGEDLSMDHGYPARIIVPALPGVHCTKWVGELRFT